MTFRSLVNSLAKALARGFGGCCLCSMSGSGRDRGMNEAITLYSVAATAIFSFFTSAVRHLEIHGATINSTRLLYLRRPCGRTLKASAPSLRALDRRFVQVDHPSTRPTLLLSLQQLRLTIQPGYQTAGTNCIAISRLDRCSESVS